MGIKGLNNVAKICLSDSAPEGSSPFMVISSGELAGKRKAYDANNYFFRIKMAFINKQDDILDIRTGEYDLNILWKRFLHEVTRVVTGILREGILPIFVFDGEAPEEKKATQNNRDDIIEKGNAKLQKLVDDVREGNIICDEDVHSEICKLARKRQVFSRKEAQVLKSYLLELGLPCIQSTTEAERLCCMMTREGIAFAVNSNDTDCIVHFAKYCITKRAGYNYEITSPRKFRRLLGLTQEKFVIFCIMLGCDYNKKVPLTNKGYGNTKALIEWMKDTPVEDIKQDVNTRFPETKLDRCIELFSPVPCRGLVEDPKLLENIKLGDISDNLSFHVDSTYLNNYGRSLEEYKAKYSKNLQEAVEDTNKNDVFDAWFEGY